jgi:hypothetical protein
MIYKTVRAFGMTGDCPNSPAGVQEPPGDVLAGVAERACDNVEFL